MLLGLFVFLNGVMGCLFARLRFDVM